MTLPRLSWKAFFYQGLLPKLRHLDARRGDAVLTSLGRLVHAAWPPRRRVITEALARSRAAGLDVDRDMLAGNVARFLARDYRLDDLSDAEVFPRFDVSGMEHLEEALSLGRGAVLLGSHLGGHVAALHWLYRKGISPRLLVQRPRHVSRYLGQQFDRTEGPHPQERLFLRRNLPPREAAERLLRARAALRDGLAVYLSGDIPWNSANARPGRFLGETWPFLSTWADLASRARAPVVPVFCTHRDGGRYRLRFDPPWTIEPGAEDQAVARYLDRLETAIRAAPDDAVAHLTWPCYQRPPLPRPCLPDRPLRPSPRSDRDTVRWPLGARVATLKIR